MDGNSYKYLYLDEQYENLTSLVEPDETRDGNRIFLVKNRGTGKIAVKKYIDAENLNVYKQLVDISDIHLENILEYAQGDEKTIVISEYINGVSLGDCISENGPMKEDAVREVLKQLLPSLNRIHKMGIVHRDINPNNVMRSQDGIRIVGKYVDENSFWGAAVLLYIENTSGRNVGVNCDNMSINGFMVTPYFSCTVYDQKKSIDDITILSTDLEDNGITSVEDLEVNFHIYDADSYETICDTGAIAFRAQ